MSSVGISFGSATSGAGFDVATTVASIMAVQRTPETAWATQTTALEAQDTVLTSLGTNMSALSTALSSLTSFDGVFSNKEGATSNTDAVALTNVGSAAAIGTHTLTVTTLAQTSQQYSNAVASAATISGTLNLTVGSGIQTSLTIASGSTVAQVAAQINASSAGVSASVVSDSNGSHLSLVSGTGGTAGELAVGGSLTDSSGNGVSFTESQPGVNAAYTLDGISLTSSSNSISNALTGVSFQLVGTSSSNVTMQIAADTSSISTALDTFVSAYNTLYKSLVGQEGKDSSGKAEPLFGSTVVSQIQSALSSALSFTAGTSSTTGTSATTSIGTTSTSKVSLAKLGLSVNTDGTLSLDTSALSTALSSNFSAVSDFFQVAGNFGQNFVSTLNQAVTIGTGTLALAIKNNSDEETNLADNKTNLEARLTTYQDSLTTELNTANQILQAIPQQLSGITQMFDAITGYKGD